MVSQQDVAKRANVSYMTVSRVVNKCGNVKKETEERVLKAIEELGYHPNAAARALNNRKTYNIGIVLPKKEYLLTAPFYIELLFSVEKQLKQNGYSLFLGSLHDDELSASDHSGLYKEGKVDGLMVFAPPFEAPFLEKLSGDDIPFTVVLGRSRGKKFNFVDVDNTGSAARVVSHLLELGHKRIGFVSGNIEEINAADRLKGYRLKLEDAGQPADEKLIYYGDWSLESGYRAYSELMTRENPPTAVFCSNDYMAMGMIKAAHDAGLKLPEDLSVAGFDDLQYSSFITPSLTTVRQPVEKIAVAAVDMMMAVISGKNSVPDEVILASEFIVRSSCLALT